MPRVVLFHAASGNGTIAGPVLARIDLRRASVQCCHLFINIPRARLPIQVLSLFRSNRRSGSVFRGAVPEIPASRRSPAEWTSRFIAKVGLESSFH